MYTLFNFLFFGVAFLFVVWKTWIYVCRRSFKNSKTGEFLNGPEPTFLIGNFLSFYSKGWAKFFTEMSAYGPVVLFFFGPFPMIVATRVDGYRHVYMKNSIYVRGFSLTQVAGKIFPFALFVLEGSLWKRHRALMNGTFGKHNITPYLQNIYDVANKIDIPLNQTFNIYPKLSLYALQILLEIIYGAKFELNAKLLDRSLIDFTLSMLAFIPGLRALIIPILRRNGKSRSSNILKMAKGKQQFEGILDALRKEKSGETPLSEEEIEGEGLGLIAAGFDTTSSTLEWLLFEVYSNPAVETKLREEIRTALAGSSEVTLETLEKMQYLDLVVRESFRKNATLSATSRISVQEDILDGFVIPKGTTIWTSPAVALNNPLDFHNPNQFIPERHLDGQTPSALIGFGVGPHVCIGQHLAWHELKIALIVFVQKYHIEILDKSLQPLPTSNIRHSPTMFVRAELVK